VLARVRHIQDHLPYIQVIYLEERDLNAG
jgi:hypothetical protein